MKRLNPAWKWGWLKLIFTCHFSIYLILFICCFPVFCCSNPSPHMCYYPVPHISTTIIYNNKTHSFSNSKLKIVSWLVNQTLRISFHIFDSIFWILIFRWELCWNGWNRFILTSWTFIFHCVLIASLTEL